MTCSKALSCTKCPGAISHRSLCGAAAEADGKGEKAEQQCRAEPEAGPAMYGCPVCRKDHILDLDRLQVHTWSACICMALCVVQQAPGILISMLPGTIAS